VDIARKGGSGLPGNRRAMTPGDAVLVRWSDGHWYHAHLKSTSDSRHHVSWDPPHQSWPSEDVAGDAIIPRMDQAREVCNFDVALAFVKKLKSMKASIIKEKFQDLELVYHWTREENVHKIVENNLRAPGAVNSDGTKVELKNGAAYGAGIYAATNMRFGQSYGGGLSCAFLCLAIPGRRANAQKLKPRDDSLQHGELRVFKTSDQLLPLFFTDSQRAHSLEECAMKILKHLRTKLLGLPAEEAVDGINVGTVVEVFDSGFWYRAKVSKFNAHNGTYDVAWTPPFHRYPPYHGVNAKSVRRLGQ